MNPLPQINVQQVATKLAQRRAGLTDFILLDVREPLELQQAGLGDEALNAPMSQLAEQGLTALPTAVQADPAVELIVMCHHGIRSAQVVHWLRQQGWENARNMTGGIAAYALIVDPSVGQY